MAAYYNDIDPACCAWTEELIKAKLIPDGVVDCRPIEEVTTNDIKGFTQCHWFNGISGWAYALQLAGWPTDEPVWCASLPCQPFSVAGRQDGASDQRHLWPAFYRLLCESRPPVCFGEQVPNAIQLGWLDGIFTDLECEGYACGAVVLPAAGVGAPHIRQRLYWVAQSGLQQAGRRHTRPEESLESDGARTSGKSGGPGEASGVAESGCAERREADCGGCHTDGAEAGRLEGTDRHSVCGPWGDFDLLPFRDGKQRRVEPGTFPLVDGFPERVGLLRGYGNAIVPQVAAAFIEAVRESL